MTPISLKIKGIHSFREEQEVDFVTLSEQGLFGIFGNTGSGKSTILDAISLALYGTSGIARGSKEFITPGSNEAVINFKFSIKNKVYTVERSFINKKDTHIAKAHKATLTSESGEIVSDHDQVTAACEKITNLTPKNFFRTIVLPQGAFSNFLKLRGKDRNKMLEEIFNLEEYGEELDKKIKNCKEILNTNLTRINVLAGDYSKVSQEACDDLKAEVETIKKELKKLDDEQQTIDKDFAEIQKKWELKQSKETHEAEYNKLKLELPKFNKTKTENERAEEANRIKESLESKNTAKKLYTEKFNFLQIVKDKLEELQAELEGITKSYELALSNKSTRIPLLSSEKTKLEQALIDEEKLTVLNKSIQETTTDIKGLYDKNNVLQEQKSNSKEAQDKLSIAIANLKQQIHDSTVTLETRGNVDNGLKILSNIAQTEKYKVDKQDDITKANNSINKLKDKLNDFATKEEELKTSNSNQEDTDALSKLEQELNQARKHDIKNMVSNLCVLGEPCPVCGHNLEEMPEFNVDNSNDSASIITQLESKIKELKSKIDDANTNHTIKITENKNNISNTQNSIKEKEADLVDLQAQLTVIQKTLEAHNTTLDELKKSTKIDDFKASSNDIKAKDKAIGVLTPMLESKQNSLESENTQITNFGESIGKLNAEIKGLESKKEAETLQAGEINKKLQKDFGEDYDIRKKLDDTISEIKDIEDEYTKSEKNKNDFDEKLKAKTNEHTETNAKVEELLKNQKNAIDIFNQKLEISSFESEEEINSSIIDEETLKSQISIVENYFETLTKKEGVFNEAVKNLGDIVITKDEFDKIASKKSDIQKQKALKNNDLGAKELEYTSSLINLKKSKIVLAKQAEIQNQFNLINTISNSLKAQGFVNYICTSRLKSICRTASPKLREITDNRYDLLLDEENNFKIKHISEGGAVLSPNTLSGGQTFMVSLTLALALSQEIQLRSATSLDFFFLDEGFDTLDEDSLSKALEVIEDLTQNTGTSLKIGVISHLASLKERIPVQLYVTLTDNGSKVGIKYV